MQEQEQGLLRLLYNISARRLKRYGRQLEEALFRPRERPPDYAELAALATVAYTRCVEWFGEPEDAARPCEIRQGYQKGLSYCAYNSILKRYIISLGADFTAPLERKNTIAHEMYHRVTSKRSGLRQELWLDEMMAHLAAKKVLREEGIARDFVQEEMTFAKKPFRMNAAQLRDAGRKTLTLGMKEKFYPKGFAEGVICLGAALDTLLPWEHLCAMATAESLDAWLDSLPEKAQYPARTLLELPPGENLPGDDPKACFLFGKALFRKGDFDAAAEALGAALRVHPYDYQTYMILGIVHKAAERREAAIAAYLEGAKLRKDAYQPCFFLSQLYREKGEFTAALEWIQKAVRLRPLNVDAHLCLGLLLDDCGRRMEARQAWEKCLTLNPDAETVETVRKALEEYPAI